MAFLFVLLPQLFVQRALLRFLLAALLGVKALALFLLALQLRCLQLAQGVLALAVGTGLLGNRAALDVSALGAHLHVHRLGGCGHAAATGGGHLQFADGASLERDLTGRAVIDLRHGFVLAVRAPQEAEQLHLFGAADDLLLIGEFHAGLAKLPEQLVHRHAQYLGELFDRDIRHRVVAPPFPRLGLVRPLSSVRHVLRRHLHPW